ncbi:hypothetical protein [Raineyella sp.]|uniref:hypothetical protein n=1 Tax=Raineyella sp. TaxID=1911550 RepID=UPI002B217F72|nr:hypothetical protein [Raineyella sp.]MEA5155637.1 hypothetical protein [Raineyella sp.]
MVANRPGVRIVLTSALAALVLAGCGTANQTPSPSPTPPKSTATSTPPQTPTPTLSADERAAVDAAQAALALYDRLAADPMADVGELTTVARDSAYLTWSSWLRDYRSNGWVGHGAQSSTLQSTDPGSDARQWIVTLCVDNSQTDMVDKDGNSVVNKDAPTRTVGVYTVTQDPTMFGWFVTAFESAGTC